MDGFLRHYNFKIEIYTVASEAPSTKDGFLRCCDQSSFFAIKLDISPLTKDGRNFMPVNQGRVSEALRLRLSLLSSIPSAKDGFLRDCDLNWRGDLWTGPSTKDGFLRDCEGMQIDNFLSGFIPSTMDGFLRCCDVTASTPTVN